MIGPTEHDDFITSIYFKDPNGLRVELTYQHASLQTLEHNFNEIKMALLSRLLVVSGRKIDVNQSILCEQ